MNFSSLVRLPIVPFAILAPVVLAATAAADILTQPPESGGRVFIGGGGNAQLITFDDAAVTNGLRQQWVFLDFDLDAILNQVPVGQSVTGARLEWFGKFNGGATLNDTIYSVFEIEGDDLGRAAILAEGIEPVDPPESGIEGHGGDDVVSYYATHTAYGAVTDTEIEESDGDNLVSWDILELVQAWEAGTAQNPGSLIILNNQNPNFSGDSQGEGSGHGGDRDWINWNSTNASPRRTYLEPFWSCSQNFQGMGLPFRSPSNPTLSFRHFPLGLPLAPFRPKIRTSSLTSTLIHWFPGQETPITRFSRPTAIA